MFGLLSKLTPPNDCLFRTSTYQILFLLHNSHNKAILYGLGDQALARALACSPAEAGASRRRVMRSLGTVGAWQQDCLLRARQTGYIEVGPGWVKVCLGCTHSMPCVVRDSSSGINEACVMLEGSVRAQRFDMPEWQILGAMMHATYICKFSPTDIFRCPIARQTSRHCEAIGGRSRI